MKKKIIINSLLLIFTLIINYNINSNYYHKSNEIVNQNITAIIESNKSGEDIISIINNNSSSDVLEKYGIDKSKVSSINKLNKEYQHHLIISSILIVIIYIIITLLELIYEKNNKNKINKIVKMLDRINHKEYSLDIDENSEDDLSNLKNEIYKITLMLKEDSLIKAEEQENLKNNLASISHQLKTPLTEISILIDNMLDTDMDEKLRCEYLNDIKTTIFNMNFLIITILKISKFDAGMIKFKKEEIETTKLVEDVKFRLKNLLDLKNINVNLIGKNIKFIGDYNWEVEAITNIVKNSIEYSNNNSNIDILVSNNNFYTKLIIKDYGSGIDKEKIKYIFERFYKVNEEVNSFGIGLSLAKSIIENDNGFIKVKSEIGSGTTFEIKYMKR